MISNCIVLNLSLEHPWLILVVFSCGSFFFVCFFLTAVWPVVLVTVSNAIPKLMLHVPAFN